MVNLYSNFISCRVEANISQVAGKTSRVSLWLYRTRWSISVDLLYRLGFSDHFDHIKKVIGAESIGIGGDFEGAMR